MANLYEMWTGAQANGRERVKQGQLAGLVNPALSGDKAAQDRMMGLDPDMGMKVQGYADTRAKGQQESQQAAQKRLGSLASGVVQAAQGGDPASVQGAYQALLQEARANNPQAQLPDAYDPADLAEIHKLVALGGGVAQGDLPTSVQEYQFAQKNPGYTDYRTQIASASRPRPHTTINGTPAWVDADGYTPMQPAGQQQPQPGQPQQLPPGNQFAGLHSSVPGLRVTSGDRTPERNAQVGGVADSYHLKPGMAQDIAPPNAEQAPAVRQWAAANGMKVIDEGDHWHLQPNGQRPAQATPPPSQSSAIPAIYHRPTPPIEMSAEIKSLWPGLSPAQRKSAVESKAGVGLTAAQVDDARRKDVERGATPTKAQEAVDAQYGKEYVEFMQGGAADANKALTELDSVLKQLEGGGNLTGPVLGMLPNAVKTRTHPTAMAAQETVESTVQRSLRVILGAQFTEKEGERLIARAYNPSLTEEYNLPRVRLLASQLREGFENKAAMARYYEQNGTLRGFTGKLPSWGDFGSDEGGPSNKRGPVSITTKAQYDALPSGAVYLEDGKQYRKP